MVYSGKEKPSRTVSKIRTAYDSNILGAKYHPSVESIVCKVFNILFRKYDKSTGNRPEQVVYTMPIERRQARKTAEHTNFCGRARLAM